MIHNIVKFALGQRFLILMLASTTFGQLASPNAAGVSMGHIHLYVHDVPAQQSFWTTMMGGVPVANGKLEMIQFPGVMILLRKAETPGGVLVLKVLKLDYDRK